MSLEGLVKLVVGILATWRLTSLICYESGPFDVFEKIRWHVGVYFEDEQGVSLTFWGRLLSCLWCTSIWIATLVTMVLLTKHWHILIPFALSAGSIIIHEGINGES